MNMNIFRGIPHPHGFSTWETNKLRANWKVNEAPRPDVALVLLPDAERYLHGWFASTRTSLEYCQFIVSLPDGTYITDGGWGYPCTVAVVKIKPVALALFGRLDPVSDLYGIKSQYPHREIREAARLAEMTEDEYCLLMEAQAKAN